MAALGGQQGGLRWPGDRWGGWELEQEVRSVLHWIFTAFRNFLFRKNFICELFSFWRLLFISFSASTKFSFPPSPCLSVELSLLLSLNPRFLAHDFSLEAILSVCCYQYLAVGIFPPICNWSPCLIDGYAHKINISLKTLISIDFAKMGFLLPVRFGFFLAGRSWFLN